MKLERGIINPEFKYLTRFTRRPEISVSSYRRGTCNFTAAYFNLPPDFDRSEGHPIVHQWWDAIESIGGNHEITEDLQEDLEFFIKDDLGMMDLNSFAGDEMLPGA